MSPDTEILRKAGFNEQAINDIMSGVEQHKQVNEKNAGAQGLFGILANTVGDVAHDIGNLPNKIQQDTAGMGIMGAPRAVISTFGTAGKVVGDVIGGGMQTANALTGGVVGANASALAQQTGLTDVARAIVPAFQSLNNSTGGVAGDLLDATNLLGLSSTVRGAAKSAAEKAAITATDTVKAGATVAKNAVVSRAPSIPSLKSVFKGAPKVVKDMMPTSESTIDHLVARAFGLAPTTDLANIKSVTGNNVGAFLTKNALLKGAPEEVISSLKSFAKSNTKSVSDIVDTVKTKYDLTSTPEIKNIAEIVSKDLADSTAASHVAARDLAQRILASDTFELRDVLKLRRATDKIESAYKATGDAKDTIKASSIAENMTGVRKFIRDEVQKVHPTIDVGLMDNNVQTSHAILNAIRKRAGKAATASTITLTDLSAFGIGSILNPVAGLTMFMANKLMNNPTIQLKIAQIIARHDAATATSEIKALLTAEASGATKTSKPTLPK